MSDTDQVDQNNDFRDAESIEQPKPEPVDAKAKLAAAEDRLLGPGVAKHDGKPERGVGSKFHSLHPAHKAHLAAIEHLIVVEAEHAAAEAHLSAIHARVEHAIKRVEATEEASAAVEEPK